MVFETKGKVLFDQDIVFARGVRTESDLPTFRIPEIAFAGRSNVGKSSLLNAITWAFYGKELHDEGVRANPIYNKIAAQECDKGLTFDVSVSLTLFDVDESGNKIPFKVERSETYFKDSKGNKHFSLSDMLSLQ